MRVKLVALLSVTLLLTLIGSSCTASQREIACECVQVEGKTKVRCHAQGRELMPPPVP